MSEKAKTRWIWCVFSAGALVVAGVLRFYWPEISQHPATIGVAWICGLFTAVNGVILWLNARRTVNATNAIEKQKLDVTEKIEAKKLEATKEIERLKNHFATDARKEAQNFELTKFRTNAYFDSQRASFARLMQAVSEFHNATRKRDPGNSAKFTEETLRPAVCRLQDAVACERIYLNEDADFALECVIYSASRTMATDEKFTLPAEEHLRLYQKLLGELFRAQLSMSDTSVPMLAFAVTKTMLYLEGRKSISFYDNALGDENAEILRAYWNARKDETIEQLPAVSRQFAFEHPEILIRCMVASKDPSKIDDLPTKLLEWLCRAGGDEWKSIRGNVEKNSTSSSSAAPLSTE